jgi:lysophospholipase
MKKVVSGLICSLVLSSQSFAISEGHYKEEYKEKILPLIKNYQHGSFKGQNNISIHYATYVSHSEAGRCVVILPGRSEAIEKYAEVIYDLDHGALAGQFQYFLMDHRGQGSSERMIKDEVLDREKGYVDHFENYTLDLKTFMDTIVAKYHCSDKSLLAHSLGAGISVDFMQSYPEYFDRAALSSPMLKIQTAPYKYPVARSIILASMAAGKGKKYAIGQKGFSGVRDFEKNTFTTSPERYEMAMGIFDALPATKLGGATNRWLNEVMNATFIIRKHYKDIHIPLRVFHAGIESYSEMSEMIRLCDEATYCNRIFLETAKHEVLMDRDVNRNIVINEIENFLK